MLHVLNDGNFGGFLKIFGVLMMVMVPDSLLLSTLYSFPITYLLPPKYLPIKEVKGIEDRDSEVDITLEGEFPCVVILGYINISPTLHRFSVFSPQYTALFLGFCDLKLDIEFSFGTL